MFSALITPPSVPSVPLSEMKAHLRVDHDDEDAEIAAYTAAAEGWLETISGLALVQQEWAFISPSMLRVMRLPRSPVVSVSSITYYDSDNVEQTVNPSEYELIPTEMPFVEFDSGFSVPSIKCRSDAVRITYTAGFDGAIPAPILQAVRLLATHQYEHRDPLDAHANVSEIPYSVMPLITPYRRADALL